MGRFGAAGLAARADDARTVELPASVSSVPVARHTVHDDLVGSGVSSALIDNTLIVVTELVSNAVLHARPVSVTGSPGVILLHWRITGSTVVVDVTDGGGRDQPQVQSAALADTAGRGLAIVDAVATFWAVHADDDRVTVQAVVGGGAA